MALLKTIRALTFDVVYYRQDAFAAMNRNENKPSLTKCESIEYTEIDKFGVDHTVCLIS